MKAFSTIYSCAFNVKMPSTCDKTGPTCWSCYQQPLFVAFSWWFLVSTSSSVFFFFLNSRLEQPLLALIPLRFFFLILEGCWLVMKFNRNAFWSRMSELISVLWERCEMWDSSQPAILIVPPMRSASFFSVFCRFAPRHLRHRMAVVVYLPALHL